MSVLLGILLDVSYSMKASIDDGINEEGGTWARSIFTVIDDLIKHDVSRSNHVFAIGFGAQLGGDSVQYGGKIFDVLTTVQNFPLVENVREGFVSEETIENILFVLERNGACSIRKWTDKSIIKESASEVDGRIILSRLRCDKTFKKRFVYEYLPKGCRDWATDDLYAYICIAPFVGLVQAFQECASSAVGQFRKATVEDVKSIVEIAMKYLRESMLVEVEEQSIYSVLDAAEIIRGRFSERDLTGQSAQQLLKLIEPYIYGSTPLHAALGKTSDLFSTTMSKYKEQRKLLFVLSDGEPSDQGDLRNIHSQLRESNVTVVGCYITRSSIVEPRRLYSLEDSRWEDGAKFLFNLSSYIQSDLVTRAVFIKQGWHIDITNNETRLFLHVNHPENLKDVCELSRNVVSSQEALSDLLTSVSLDIYINQRNTSNRAPMQVGGTCYANASATVLHLSMRRILGRDGGYLDFEDLRNNLIERNGIEGANTFQVLRNICPKYRLHCKEVKVEEALQAIAAKRPVVAKFRLTEEEWKTFRRFYKPKKRPTGILKKRDLDINNRDSNAELLGHAVVLTSYNSECLRLMNSWGDKWADMGFFRVENADVLDLKFMDVFWKEKDLSPNEKAYYSEHGSEVADKLVTSLRGLQEALFTCPLCDKTSKVTLFRGTLSNAVCPQCNQEFSSRNADANILALNMYLTSLSR